MMILRLMRSASTFTTRYLQRMESVSQCPTSVRSFASFARASMKTRPSRQDERPDVPCRNDNRNTERQVARDHRGKAQGESTASVSLVGKRNRGEPERCDTQIPATFDRPSNMDAR